jgi:peptidoglycan hydrolase-like protein with peptidoglycan-binding domain
MATVTQSATLPQLQKDDKGEAVRFLQQLLITFGFLENGQFNAVFDENTKNAVIAFQRSYFTQDPSADDGIVGPKTWEALGDYFHRD